MLLLAPARSDGSEAAAGLAPLAAVPVIIVVGGAVTTIWRQEICYWCGAELVHSATGRGKRFCSAKCRIYHRRAVKKWARACDDEALAGQPEPARDFGYPVKIATYEVAPDGTVTKRPRPA